MNSHAPRLGFLGGTFDPPHNGHLQIAQIAIKQASLDKLLLCPAHQTPLRTNKPLFSPKHRLAMITSICKNHPKIDVFDAEIKHGKKRFSFQTIQEIKSHFPDYEIFFILGADQFSRLPEWKNIRLLAKLVHFLVFARHSKCPSIPYVNNLNFSFMDNDLINISSTDIRKHIHSKQSLVSLVPSEVSKYLSTQNLFSLENTNTA